MDKLSPNPWAGQQNERSHVSVLRCQKSEKVNVWWQCPRHHWPDTFKVHLKTSKNCVCVCMYINQKRCPLILYIIYIYHISCHFWQALSKILKSWVFRKSLWNRAHPGKNLPPPLCRTRGFFWAQGPPTTRVRPPGPVWQMGWSNRSTYPYRTPPRRNHENQWLIKPLIRPYFWGFIREGRLTSHYNTKKSANKTSWSRGTSKRMKMLKNCDAINLSNVIFLNIIHILSEYFTIIK